MGAGKTSAGRLISKALDLPLSDSDPFLRKRYGATAAQIAASEGADVLHQREAEHVLAELAGEPKVITAAASAVEDPRVREALREAFVVWVDAPDAVLAQRMRSGDHRPDFAPSVMRARREPYFREVADITFDVSTTTPEEVAEGTLRALRSPARDGG
ncbi:shikimate kinase [Nonomuraea rhodomycinica]|uniref:Shikimate kinase n=2 Tax=Nonomuraea rhodomycinica TaxID=1712872 RepID=A0A7Y6IQP8_9ACTN|nr:shikimate kinase [Nonomuraea rhodomycinica]